MRGEEEGRRRARLGREASHRLEPGDLRAHRPHDPPPTGERSEGDGGVGGEHDPERYTCLRTELLGPDQHGQDDAHRLLGVVGPVTERESGRRHELPAPEAPIEPVDPADPVEDVEDHQHEDHPEGEPDERREHDEDGDGPEATLDEHMDPSPCDRGAGHAADEGVRRAAREPQIERDEVPTDRPREAGEDHADRQHVELRVHHVLGDGVGHLGAEDQEGDEVEEGGPEHSEAWREDTGRYDGRHRVGGVVEPVREVEGERDQNDEDEPDSHGVLYACLRTTDSTTSAMSSTVLSAASMASTTSFHFRTSMAS